MAENEQTNRSNIPENSSTKPMDSKRDVEQSPDEKTDEDFPGYPHYPAKEDIMDQRTGAHRVDANLEDRGTGPNASGVNQQFLSGNQSNRESGEEQNNEAEGEGGTANVVNDEIGTPQNVSNEDLSNGDNRAGTDVDEAAEKGSLNP